MNKSVICHPGEYDYVQPMSVDGDVILVSDWLELEVCMERTPTIPAHFTRFD